MERQNLRLMLTKLRKRLVAEHGWEQAHEIWRHGKAGEQTGLIVALIQQVDTNPQMRELINELGFGWPMADSEEAVAIRREEATTPSTELDRLNGGTEHMRKLRKDYHGEGKMIIDDSDPKEKD